MSDQRIQVFAYSGYRGEEIPRAMIIRDVRIDVVKILNMLIEEGVEDRGRKRFFEFEGHDRKNYRIYYLEKAGEWYHKVED